MSESKYTGTNEAEIVDTKKAAAAADRKSVSGLIGVETAKRHLRTVQELRRKGVATAQKLESELRQLVAKGILLNEKTLESYLEFSELCQSEIRSVNEALRDCSWPLPDLSTGLAAWETSLQRLHDHVRKEADAHAAERERFAFLADIVCSLQCSRGAGASLLEEAHRKAQVWRADLRSDERWLAAVEAPERSAFEALLQLMLDSCEDAVEEMTLEEADALSDEVEKHFGRKLSVAALRGHLEPTGASADDIRRILNGDSADGDDSDASAVSVPLPELRIGAAAEEDTDTAEGAAVRSVPGSLQHIDTAEDVTDEELAEVAIRVRSHAEQLWPRAVQEASDWTPSGPAERKAFGLLNLADAIELVLEIKSSRNGDVSRHRKPLHSALRLLAKAQCAVRDEHAEHAASEWDLYPDQSRTFYWLKYLTKHERFGIERYMKRDHHFDPDNNGEVRAEILEMRSEWDAPKLIRKGISKIEYELGRAAEDEDSSLPHWETVVRTVDELLEMGVYASDAGLRSVLLPRLDEIPDALEFSAGFEKVLQETDRYIALQEEQGKQEQGSHEKLGAHVEPIARLMEGHSVLLIGGQRRPKMQDKLRKAFRLSNFIWESAEKHDRIDRFRSLVSRDDVVLVILATRLMGHLHNDVRDFCRSEGKPVVMLPAGYSINRTALAIERQALKQLEDNLGRNGNAA